jgi:hypothetical protein
LHFIDIITMFTQILSQRPIKMKKNLLTAIVIFFFTYIVLFITSSAPDKESNQIEDQLYIVKR